MSNRMITVVVCGLLLAGCQQAGSERAALAGPTPPLVSADRSVDVPFSGTLTGVVAFDIANPRGCALGFTAVTDATGIASHLGRTTFHGEHCVQLGVGGGSIVGGVLVLTAANGDELHGTYTGSFGAFPAIGEPIVSTLTWVISGGTGRFEHASGTAASTATVPWEGEGDPSSPGRWEWTGTLRY